MTGHFVFQLTVAGIVLVGFVGTAGAQEWESRSRTVSATGTARLVFNRDGDPDAFVIPGDKQWHVVSAGNELLRRGRDLSSARSGIR